jgi:hypothetical protein
MKLFDSFKPIATHRTQLGNLRDIFTFAVEGRGWEDSGRFARAENQEGANDRKI